MSDFTLAIAIQNLAWGLLQAVAGAMVVKYGYRPLMVGGAALYVIGLVFLATAQGLISVIIGAGLCMGVAMSCTASALANSVASRAVPVHVRSIMLGVVTAVGSLGAMIAAPIGQGLTQAFGWRGGRHRLRRARPRHDPGCVVRQPRRQDSAAGRGQPRDRRRERPPGICVRPRITCRFVVMTCAYFVCGMQLVFLTTHLPSYCRCAAWTLCWARRRSAPSARSTSSAACSSAGAGQRWNKLVLLGCLYISRSIVLTFYFVAPPTPTTTLLFAAIMGFLGSDVSPLTAGAVAEMFGLRWQPMIQGIAFVSHQMGSTLGALGGGLLIYDALGSYALAWQIGVSLGLTAGVVQIAFALWARRRNSWRSSGSSPRNVSRFLALVHGNTDWKETCHGTSGANPPRSRKHMDVISSDGANDRLGRPHGRHEPDQAGTKHDAPDGKHHLIPLTWVTTWTSTCISNKAANDAKAQWKAA